MKKRIIILGSVILFVVVAWSGAWLFAANFVRNQIDQLAFADGETMPQLTCGTLEVSGFPFRFDVTCINTSIVSGDLLVEVPTVRASAMIYRPTHLLAFAQGPAVLSDAFSGQRQEVSWKGLDASIRLEDWRIVRASVVGQEMAWTDKLFGDNLIARSSHVEGHLIDMPELHDPATGRSALAAYMRAAEIDLPGIELAQTNAELEAEITQLPDDVRNWGAVPFLPDWQQAGGTLKIVGIRANDGTNDLVATGEMSLDAQGYPTGQIAIDSLGIAERLQPFLEEPWRTLVLGVAGADGRHMNQLNFAAGGMSSGLVPITAVPSLF